MMKNLFTTFCFITVFFCTAFGQAQIKSGKILYKVKGNDQALEKALADGSVQKRFHSTERGVYEKNKRGLPYLNYTLTFNQDESLFQGEEKMSNDNQIDLNKIERWIGATGDFYSKISEDESLHYINYYNHKWLIHRSIKEFDWNITQETKIIQGYTCYKATAKYAPELVAEGTMTAWFTPQIPFQYGPLRYAGLPGLILELNQEYYTFYADKIQLSKKDHQIKKPTKGKQLNYKEYRKELKRTTDQLIKNYAQQHR